MSGQVIAGPWPGIDDGREARAARARAVQALAEYDARRTGPDARNPVFWGEMSGLLSEVLRTWLDVTLTGDESMSSGRQNVRFDL